jgi:hypothetical protein
VAKVNYAAWHVSPSEFSKDLPDIKKLQFFAKYAILAPSGHNTQPWRLSQADNTLLLKADYSRLLPYSGVLAKEPYVSLGSFLGVFELAAKGLGYKVAIKYELKDDLIATIRLAGQTAADPSLLEAITHRVSNRNFYKTDPVHDSYLTEITRSEFKNVSTLVISDRDDIAYIADLTTQATLTTFADKEFRAELSKWVRNNLTRQHDGMPGFVQGIPTPVSMFAKHAVKNLDISKDQAKKDSTRILHSGNLAVISIENPTEAALLDGGRVYAQICVLAQLHGFATTGAGAAIIDPETTQEMIKKFKLPGKPIAIIRLGTATKAAKHAPRWPLSKLLD